MPSTATVTRQELERRIVLETDEVVIVDKPWGVPSTGRQLDDPDSLQFALIQRYGGMTWAVHQLDADTSGLNVFVRQRQLAGPWHARMRYPNCEKTYLAVVHGNLAEDHVVDAPIGTIETEPSISLGVTPDGRSARSRFQVLDRSHDLSLVRVQIETGRTHQIRIHASSIGHPLVGEDWYRDPPCERHVRQALHAWQLHFSDEQEPKSLLCPLPPDLVELLQAEGLRVGDGSVSA